MKTSLIASVVLACACSSFGQGSIQFNNRVPGISTSAVVAPIYGPDLSDPVGSKYGNAATAPTTPIPTGTQTYGGAPLTGTGYTAGIWARPAGSSDAFVFAASTPFRVTTTLALYGFWQPPIAAVILPNVPSSASVRAEILIRVWDNQGGTLTSWDQFHDPNTGQLTIPFGWQAESLPFVVPDQLGGGTVLPPTLKGLQSFQLSLRYGIVAPEPSTSALLMATIAGAITFGFRRRGKE